MARGEGKATTMLVNVGRHRAVGGLQWELTPGVDASDFRRAAKRQVKQAGSRFGAMHITGGHDENHHLQGMVGILQPEAPKASVGGYSAAAWLAHTATRFTLYIENQGNRRFWMIAVEPGQIDPRTDRILSDSETRDLIDNILGDQMTATELPLVVVVGEAPVANMLTRAAPQFSTSLADLLGTAPPPKAARITQLVGIKPVALAAVAGVVLAGVAGVYGYQQYQQMKQQRAFEEAQALARAEQLRADQLASMAEINMARAVEAAIREDTQTVPPDAVVDACVQLVSLLARPMGGWEFQDATCDPNGVGMTATYRLPKGGEAFTGATNETLLLSVQELGIDPVINLESEEAQLLLPMTPAAPRAGLRVHQIPLWIDINRSVPSRFQWWRGTAEQLIAGFSTPMLREIQYEDPTAPEGDPARTKLVPVDRAYRKGRITLGGEELWTLQAFRMSDWPFVTLNALAFRVGGAGLTWTMEASYVTSSI